MKNLLYFTPLPLPEMLAKLTVLLALAWMAHCLLRSRDARWRLVLWRGVFCFGLALPVIQMLPLPAIPIPSFAQSAPAAMGGASGTKELNSLEQLTEAAPQNVIPAQPITFVQHQRFVTQGAIPWQRIFLAGWVFGAIGGMLRLLSFMSQLSMLKKNAVPADPANQTLAREILKRSGVNRSVQILVSESATSPFVFGVFTPTILLPAKLMKDLPPTEAAALLAHEAAHLQRNDLFWCVGWRWMKVALWFHPLVWKIPNAHNLACEEEADRRACGQLDNRETYAQLLAQLALRALAIPQMETQLTANGSAEITQRLQRLGRGMGKWKRAHSIAAFAMVLGLVLVSAGCKLGVSKDFSNRSVKLQKRATLAEKSVAVYNAPGGTPPYAYTQVPAPVHSKSATLNGMVLPNGKPALAWFQWGTTTNYEFSTPVQNIGEGSAVIRLSVPVTGLAAGAVYHYRVVSCTVGGAAVCGADQMFTTGMSVAAWGEPTTGNTQVPPGLSNVVAIACGHGHSLALKADGTVAAWGGQGGSGLDPYTGYTQTQVPAGLRQVIAIAGGYSQSLAVTEDGKVVAWGEYMDHTPVVLPSGLSNVIAVAAGDHHAMALKADGTIIAWGNRQNPGATKVPRGLSNVVAIASGSGHCIALKADGCLVEWGYNFDGHAPQGLSNVVAISGDAFTCLALQSDGTVTAWGESRFQDTKVPDNLGDVVAIAAGWKHSVALRANGSIAAWGDNSQGQANVPAALHYAVAIASGDLHSLALGVVGDVATHTANAVEQTSTPAKFDVRAVLDPNSPDGDDYVLSDKSATGQVSKEVLRLHKLFHFDNGAIKSASIERDPADDEWEVIIHLHQAAAQRWREITREDINKRIAILIDGKLFMAPIIRGEIRDGSLKLRHSLTEQEARELAARLNVSSAFAP